MTRVKADEGEEKLEDKLELSPWAEAEDEDAENRTFGWRGGESLTRSEVHEILKREKNSRIQYRGLRKAINKMRQTEQADPLEGLPPEWQAFWGSVPGADVQAAYKEHAREQQRTQRAEEKAAAAAAEENKVDWESKPGETLDEEVVRLEHRISQLREVLTDKERISQEWAKKIVKIRKIEADGEEKSRSVRRKLEAASYNHGMTMGKLRSSDGYFQFLYQDTAADAKTQVVTLQRSNALMDKSMDLLKGHVRMLLKVAAETERQSSAGDGKSPRSDSATMRAAMKAPPVSPSLHG